MRADDTVATTGPQPQQPPPPPVQPMPSALRSGDFRPPRRRWPGLLAAGVIGAGLAAAAVSSLYDARPLGARLDAGLATARDAVHSTASNTAEAAGEAAASAAAAMNDAAITAAVKTALAADPTLSAVKIDVTTTEGIVRLDGPAPDARARERAEMLAGAPQGVVRVDNRLVVPETQARL